MDKNILIIRRYSGYGGIEYQIENTVSNLIKRGWNISFLTDVQSPLSDSLVKKNIQVTIEPFNGLFCTARRIWKICKNNNIVLVQSHVLKDSFACRIAKLFCPSLLHVFRVHTYIDCSHISQFKKNLYHFACWITDALVDAYVPINDFNKTEMLQRTHIPANKIHTVHNVILPLAYEDKQNENFRNGHIAMIANFVDFKGHDVLLKGIEILKSKNCHITVHLFGGVPGAGTDKADYHRLEIIQAFVSEHHLEQQVIFHGYSSNIAEAIQDCGMVVLPSDAEGTPNALLQGMMLHKVIVASAVGGIPEFVIDGQTGFLHAAQDPQGFAEAIIRAYETPDDVLQEMVLRAAKLIEKEYSVENVIDEFSEIYQQVMQK